MTRYDENKNGNNATRDHNSTVEAFKHDEAVVEVNHATTGNVKEESVLAGGKRVQPEKEIFKFKRRGKLNKKEESELKRSHKSLSTWLTPKAKVVSNPDDGVARDKEILEKDRENKLEIVRRKKMAWVSTAMSRSIILEIVKEAARRAEMAHCVHLVKGMVSRAWLEIVTRRLVNELMEVDEIVQIEVGIRVKALRLENKSLEREEKLEKARNKKEAFITTNITKTIMLELVDTVVMLSEESHCAQMVLAMVDMACLEVETGKMTIDMKTAMEVDVLEPGDIDDVLMEVDKNNHNEEEVMATDITESPNMIETEKFGNINDMIVFWEMMEGEEETPVKEIVVTRRKSERIEEFLNIFDQKPENTNQNDRPVDFSSLEEMDNNFNLSTFKGSKGSRNKSKSIIVSNNTITVTANENARIGIKRKLSDTGVQESKRWRDGAQQIKSN